MSKDNFERSLEKVLVHEGNYSNHPSDPGGVTLQGVIQRVYNAYRRGKGLGTRPLTKSMIGRKDWIAERNEIYRQNYWNKIKGDSLPDGIDYLVFDAAVNSGPAQAAKWLQRAVKVTADGKIGPITLAAVRKADPNYIIAKFSDNRLAMLKGLSTWKVFGKGWSARVAEVEQKATEWAA